MNRQAISLKILATAVVAWLTVFLSGYGVMSVFWYYSDYTEKRGFHYFYSATWGDGLFLSTMIASMIVYLMAASLYRTIKTKLWVERTSWAIGSIGGFVGAMVQISWVTNHNIITNWTIPYPHYFNYPGWYHAGFFIIMFGAIAYFTTRIFLERIFVAPHARVKSSLMNLSYSLIWFGIAGFVFTRLKDEPYIGFLGNYDFKSVSDAPIVITAIVIIGIIYSKTTSIIARWINRTRSGPVLWSALHYETRSILAGVLFAYGISLLIIHHPMPVFAIGLALCCIGLIVPVPQYSAQTWTVAYLLGASGFGIASWMTVAISSDVVISISDIISLMIMIIIGVIAFTPIIWIAESAQNLDRVLNAARLRQFTILFGIGFIFIMLTYGFWDQLIEINIIKNWQWNNDKGKWKDEIRSLWPTGILIGGEYAVWVWNKFVKAGDIPWVKRKNQEYGIQTKAVAWFSVLSVSVGSLIIYARPIQKTLEQIDITLSVILTTVLISIIIFIIIELHLKFRNKLFWKWFSLLAFSALYLLVTYFIIDFGEARRYNWFLLFAAPSVIFGSVFIYNGIIGNMLLLRGRKPDIFGKLLSIIIGFGVFCIYASIFLLKSVVLGIIIYFLCTIISIRAAGMLSSLSDDKNMVLWDTAGGFKGVLQDLAFGSLMALLGGLFVVSYLERNGSTVGTLLNLLALGSWSYFRVIRKTLINNYDHLTGQDGYTTTERFKKALEKAKADSDPRQLKQFMNQQRNLKYHLERQAWLVVLALFPWTIGFVIGASSAAFRQYIDRKTPRQISFREMFGSHLYNNYLIETSIIDGTHSRQQNTKLGYDTGFDKTKSWLHDITHYPA